MGVEAWYLLWAASGAQTPLPSREAWGSHFRQQFWPKAFWDSPWGEDWGRVQAGLGPLQVGSEWPQTGVLLETGSTCLLEALPGGAGASAFPSAWRPLSPASSGPQSPLPRWEGMGASDTRRAAVKRELLFATRLQCLSGFQFNSNNAH